MFGQPRLCVAAALLAAVFCPLHACRAAEGWAAYMFESGFEAGDHVDPGEGVGQSITTVPRNGAGNVALHGVGAGYGVLKLVADPPHWSDDGH